MAFRFSIVDLCESIKSGNGTKKLITSLYLLMMTGMLTIYFLYRKQVIVVYQTIIADSLYLQKFDPNVTLSSARIQFDLTEFAGLTNKQMHRSWLCF